MRARSRLRGETLLTLAAGSALVAGLLLAPQRPAASASAIPTPESVLGFVPGEDRKLADWSATNALPPGSFAS